MTTTKVKAALNGTKRAHMPHFPLMGTSARHAKHVTVFGAAFPSKSEYELAQAVGKTIAQARMVLVNGGYGGTMEASANGCANAGGQVIGVAISGNRISCGKRPNEHNTIVHEASSMNDRVEKMLESEYIIVLDGTIGTLHELVAALAQKQYDDPSRHIAVLGERNKALLLYLEKQGFLPAGLFEQIEFPDSIEELRNIFYFPIQK